MTALNKTAKTVAALNPLPSLIRQYILTLAIGYVVKFMGTARVKVKKLTQSRVELRLANHKKVRNHIGGIAAAAVVLMAETASGLVVSMNVLNNSVPVLKSMNFKFIRRAQGAMTAIATLTPDQINEINTSEKGNTKVHMKMTDETGNEPIVGEMQWAWTPKQR